jgi:hypothetical protein
LRSNHWRPAVLQNNARTCHLCFHLGPSSPSNHSPILLPSKPFPKQSWSFPNRGRGGSRRSSSRGCWPWRRRPPSSPRPHPPAASSSRSHPPVASSSCPHRVQGSGHGHDCSRRRIHDGGHSQSSQPEFHSIRNNACCSVQVLGGSARRGGGEQIRLPFLLGGEPQVHVPDRQRRRPARRSQGALLHLRRAGPLAAGMKLEVRVRPAGCDRPPVINNGTSVSNGKGTHGGSICVGAARRRPSSSPLATPPTAPRLELQAASALRLPSWRR